MSFRCSNCNEPQAPGKRPNRVIKEVRRKIYYRNGEPSSEGWEIGGEADYCDPCYAAADVAPVAPVSQPAPTRFGDGIHTALNRAIHAA